MSYKVTEAFIEYSRSKHGARTVGLIIAEVAHHDGVGWLLQQPSKKKKWEGREHKANIAVRANLSPKQVRRCVDRMQDLDELEVVWARDVAGERFFVYRLIVGPFRMIDVDYDRGLPYLEAQFWTPDELMSPWWERPLNGHSLSPTQAAKAAHRAAVTGGQIVPRDKAEDEAEPGDIRADLGGHPRPLDGGTSAPPPSLLDRSKGQPSEEPSLDQPDKEHLVGDGSAVDEPVKTKPKDLVIAFAQAIGYWPADHGEWSTWCAALKPLVDAGITADEVGSRTKLYLSRWKLDVSPDSPAFMFSLTKHYQRISASLERSYFGLFRWATDTSWRLGDIDEARWVVETSDRITDKERARLLEVVGEAYRAHSDVSSDLLRWVESEGWTLNDDLWRRELNLRMANQAVFRDSTDLRRKARERRLEIRQAFAQLDLGEEIA